jgi:hypothetical protein
MAEVMADRRDFPRYALTLVAHLSEPGNSAVLIARSSDVSRSGEDVFETMARVVYLGPGLGMGVKWAIDRPDQQQRFAVPDRWLQKAPRT